MPTVEMNVLVPAVAALVGALVGSVAPIVVGVIQARAEHRRERMRLATQLAIEDHHANIELAKIAKGRVALAPMSAGLAYHAELLNLLSKGKELTPERFVELRKRARAVFETLEDYQTAEEGFGQRGRNEKPAAESTAG